MNTNKLPVPEPEPVHQAGSIDDKIAAENIQHREFIQQHRRTQKTSLQRAANAVNQHRLVSIVVVISLIVGFSAIPSLLRHDTNPRTEPVASDETGQDDPYVVDEEQFGTEDNSTTSPQLGSETNSGAGPTSSGVSSGKLAVTSAIYVTSRSTSAVVNWTRIPGATQYEIQLSRSSSMTSPRQVTSGINQSVLFELRSSTTYYVRVRGVNALTAGAWSAPKLFMTAKITPQVQQLPYPGVVPNFTGVVKSEVSVALSWSAASHGERYTIVRSSDAAQTSGKKEYSSVSGTQYTVSDLRAGTLYYFTIRAVNSRGSGPVSTAVSCKTRLATPAIKSLALLSNNGIRVSYQNSTGATKYQIRIATSKSFSGAKTQNSTQTSTIFTALKPETRYYFQVRAADKAYTTGWSAIRDIRTAAAPRLPINATFSFQNLGRENVSPTNVFQRIKSGLAGRANVVYDFAEIDASDPYNEHAALKKVFGTSGWAWFSSDQPILARLGTDWKSDGTSLVKLLDGGQVFRSHGCPTGSEHLMISLYVNRQNVKTKFAVVNTHFITHAYQSSGNNSWCRGYWDRSWQKLKDKVASLSDRGYDVVITADFNHHSSEFPYLHRNARLIHKNGPDVIFAIPTKGRSVVVDGKGIINTPTGESFHKDIWARLTFKGK